MSTESGMPSNHLIHCCPFLLLPLVFPSIRVFSSESDLFQWVGSSQESGCLSTSEDCWQGAFISWHLCSVQAAGCGMEPLLPKSRGTCTSNWISKARLGVGLWQHLLKSMFWNKTEQRSANFFWKVPAGRYFKLWVPHMVTLTYFSFSFLYIKM